ncbi:MAG: hypothetical protein M0R68_04005 [Bacteroidetes bacterium]|nr:hypothetical protein [Bacteroidota bacterium]
MAIDVELLRLQYEILNVSVESLARSAGIPQDLIQREIDKGRWTVLWPDENEPKLVVEEDEDLFTVSTNQYIDKTRRRLQAYSYAKEILLATRYLELESNLIKKANQVLENLTTVDMTAASGLKTLSSLYRDLSKGLSSVSSLSLGTDEEGLPTVIIKDLSGRDQMTMRATRSPRTNPNPPLDTKCDDAI